MILVARFADGSQIESDLTIVAAMQNSSDGVVYSDAVAPTETCHSEFAQRLWQYAKLPPSIKQLTDRTVNARAEIDCYFFSAGRDAPADCFSEIQIKYISLYGLIDVDRRL